MTWLDHSRQRCKLIKALAEPFEWFERPNHANAFSATAGFLDSNNVTIPGLSVQFEYQRRTFGEYYKYGLFDKQGSAKHRVLMIEAMPSHRRAHVDVNGDIWGSHILLGDSRAGAYIVRKIISGIEISDHLRWIDRFKRHVLIIAKDHDLTPVSGDIFAAGNRR